MTLSVPRRWIYFRFADLLGLFIGSVIAALFFRGTSILEIVGSVFEIVGFVVATFIAWYIFTGYIFVLMIRGLVYQKNPTLGIRFAREIWVFVIHSLLAMLGFAIGGERLLNPIFLGVWSMVLIANIALFIWIEKEHFKHLIGQKVHFYKWMKLRIIDFVTLLIIGGLYYFRVMSEADDWDGVALFLSGYLFVIYIPSSVELLFAISPDQNSLKNIFFYEFFYLFCYTVVCVTALQFSEFPIAFNHEFWVVLAGYASLKLITVILLEREAVYE